MINNPRTVSWFSCGAASAVATKLAISAQLMPVQVVYCEVKEEHPDNVRFLKDCEKWFGQEIIILGNDKYNRSIYDVFEKTRYLAGHNGARCTLELKKNIRKEYEKPDDVQVFGYTCEEQRRVDLFIDANNDVDIVTPLIDKGLTKQDCLAMIENAGIELPAMYKLGYKNNNCRGCVKAQSPAYWKKIKIDFPEFFYKMLAQEKRLNVKICKATIDGVSDVRMQLDSLPEWIEPMDDTVDIQCGIFCHMAENDYK
ncbi:MAG: phosphoadenosine phosphosulfate reductase family protein [Deltaproteobacteria bacterium]|nr:phosphoadenosine phosphosulfate reductase family protein [Deltaproteobacteria bacterium]